MSCWKVEWSAKVKTYLRQHHARLLSTKQDILPAWKAEFGSYHIKPPQGKDPFMPVYTALLDSVAKDEPVDYDSMVQSCLFGVNAEAKSNWLDFPNPSDLKYLEAQYAFRMLLSL